MSKSKIKSFCACDMCTREDEIDQHPQIKAMRVLLRSVRGNKHEAAEVRHFIRLKKEELRKL